MDKDPELFKLMLTSLNYNNLFCTQIPAITGRMHDLFDFMCIHDYSKMFIDSIFRSPPVFMGNCNVVKQVKCKKILEAAKIVYRTSQFDLNSFLFRDQEGKD